MQVFCKNNLTDYLEISQWKGFKVTTEMQPAWFQVPGYSTKESFSQTLDYITHCYVFCGWGCYMILVD